MILKTTYKSGLRSRALHSASLWIARFFNKANAPFVQQEILVNKAWNKFRKKWKKKKNKLDNSKTEIWLKFFGNIIKQILKIKRNEIFWKRPPLQIE